MKTSLILVVCCLAFFACREETKIVPEQEDHLPKLVYYTISEA